MGSCIYKPTVIKNGEEVESKLFNDLLSLTGNRESSKQLWALSQISEFTDTLSDLKYDENGEVTIESLDNAIKIKDLIEGKTTLLTEKRKVGAIDENNEPIKHDNAESIIDRVINFNKDNTNLVADISKVEDKYVINVNTKNIENENVPNELMFSNSLNNHLRMLMNSLGFDVAVKDKLMHPGIFDPTQGQETANTLKTVIQVVKGELGELAMPEEFSHFIIEGLMKEPLVQRLLKSLENEDAVESILGEEFEQYNELYKGDTFLLQKEAAGKLLHAAITKENVPDVPLTIVGRLWNWVKNRLDKLTENDIDKAIREANDTVEKIAPAILDGALLPLFDKSLLQDSKPLYKVAAKVDKLTEAAENALRLYSKRLKIIQARSKNGKYNKNDLKAIKNILKLNEEKKYVRSSLAFLTESLTEIQSLQETINNLNNNKNQSDIIEIGKMSKVLRTIKEFIDAYSPVIDDMRVMKLFLESGEVIISALDAIKIADKASEISDIIAYLNNTYKLLRFNTVFNFQKLFFEENKMVNLAKNKDDLNTLELLLTMAHKDIGIIDRYLSSMSDASDPLLSIIDRIVKNSQSRRDNLLESLLFGLRESHIKLLRAGHDTKFMYARDEKGNLTNHIISDIDFIKFDKYKREFIESLKKKGLKNYTILAKVDAWERKNMESVLVDKGTGRKEVLPSKSIYGIDRLSKLTSAQRTYYDEMLRLKAKLDSMIPAKHAHMYNSIYIRNDVTEGLFNDSVGLAKSSKLIISSLKDKILRRSDDTEYGQGVFDLKDYNDWVIANNIDVSTPELERDAEKKYRKYLRSTEQQILTDFSGKKVENIPVFYTNPLEDMSRLSTDFTSSILAYAGMAINYAEMNKIVDVMELTRDLIRDREIQQMKGDKKLVETFKSVNRVYKKAYTKKGDSTNIVGRTDDYYSSEFYGKQKVDEGSLRLFGKTVKIGQDEISISKVADTMKSYTGEVGLALNMFSALNNVVIGKFQMFLESIGGEYYNLKDSAIAKKNYYLLLPEYMGELNSIVKNSFLELLIDKFDALEEFNSNVKNKTFYNSKVGRIIGDSSTLFLSSAGEHYLHARNMLAMLNANKVLNSSGKEIAIFDAYKAKEYKDSNGKSLGSKLVFKNGTKTLEGEILFTEELQDELLKLRESDIKNEKRIKELEDIELFTNNKMNNLKLKIGKVSQTLNGAFNNVDKGAIHRYALGRLAMQFRQWMPAHYSRRFASEYYDASLDSWREGYYRTIGKFTWNLISDIRKRNFHIATNWQQLSNHEKANLKKGITELSFFAILSGLIAMMGPPKEKKGLWAQRVLLYLMKRLQLEISAVIPIHPDIIDNLWTMLLSPIPSIKSFNSLGDLAQFWNIFNEIESGRYKGWSEYSRDAYNTVPYVHHFRKLKDITDEDYMFNIFK